MTLLTLEYKCNNALRNADSVKFSSPDGAFGLRERGTGTIIIADNTAWSHPSTGIYTYNVAEYIRDVEYWVKLVDNGKVTRTKGQLKATPRVITSTSNRRSNHNVYELKMLHGEPVDFYYNIEKSQDLDTGDMSTTKDRISIKRAVITSLASKYHYEGAPQSTYQKDDMVVLVDLKDLYNYEQNKEDYFVHKGKKFLIVTHELIPNECRIFVVRHIQGEEPRQEKVVYIRHALRFSSGVTNE